MDNQPGSQTAKRHRIILLVIFVSSCLLLQSIRLSGDGLSYYAYLRSLLFDGDLDFTNEFQDYNPLGHATPDPTLKTKTGLVANPYAVGPAILWTPFVLAAHILSSVIGGDGSSVTGYEFQYVAGLVLGTNFYAFMGLLALYDVSTRFFARHPALIAVLAVWLGTPWVNYLYFEPGYAHVLSASLVAVFIWSHLDSRAQSGRQNRGCLAVRTGIVAGLMMLSRWQNAIFLVVPVLDILVGRFRGGTIDRKQMTLVIAQIFLLVGTAVLVFIPQVVVWHHVYGHWFVIPMGSGFVRLSSPSLLAVLFSPRNGLFSWTPLIPLSLLGMIALARRDRILAIGLLVAILAQWYLNASVVDWWGGSAFGGRRFIGSSAIFVLGLAGLLDAAWQNRTWRIVAMIGVISGMIWNILLWTQYAIGTPPVQSLTSLTQIYLGQFKYGLPNIYRLFGRSTWLDLALRSGLFKWEWKNVFVAFAWLVMLTLATYIAFRWWNHPGSIERLSRWRIKTWN